MTFRMPSILQAQVWGGRTSEDGQRPAATTSTAGCPHVDSLGGNDKMGQGKAGNLEAFICCLTSLRRTLKVTQKQPLAVNVCALCEAQANVLENLGVDLRAVLPEYRAERDKKKKSQEKIFFIFLSSHLSHILFSFNRRLRSTC